MSQNHEVSQARGQDSFQNSHGPTMTFLSVEGVSTHPHFLVFGRFLKHPQATALTLDPALKTTLDSFLIERAHAYDSNGSRDHLVAATKSSRTETVRQTPQACVFRTRRPSFGACHRHRGWIGWETPTQMDGTVEGAQEWLSTHTKSNLGYV